MNARHLLLALLFVVFSASQSARAAAPEGIAWIPTWNQAVAEARQTNKPILLMAAAPECGGVPGVW